MESLLISCFPGSFQLLTMDLLWPTDNYLKQCFIKQCAARVSQMCGKNLLKMVQVPRTPLVYEKKKLLTINLFSRSIIENNKSQMLMIIFFVLFALKFLWSITFQTKKSFIWFFLLLFIWGIFPSPFHKESLPWKSWFCCWLYS